MIAWTKIVNVCPNIFFARVYGLGARAPKSSFWQLLAKMNANASEHRYFACLSTDWRDFFYWIAGLNIFLQCAELHLLTVFRFGDSWKQEI